MSHTELFETIILKRYFQWVNTLMFAVIFGFFFLLMQLSGEILALSLDSRGSANEQ